MKRVFLLLSICLLCLSSVGQAQTVFKDGKISKPNFLPTVEQKKEIRALAEIRLPSPNLPKCKGSPTIIRTEKDYNRVINLWKNCTGELTVILNGQYFAKFFGELGPNGTPHGVGIATWYEAHPEFNKFRKYVGEFKNDRREGRGVLTLADGSTQEGIWANDSFKREEILRSPLYQISQHARQIHQLIGTIVLALLPMQMATNTLVSSRTTKHTDKAPIPMDQTLNGLATNTLVSTEMINHTDKAPIPTPMATNTLVSSRLTSFTDKAL